MGMKEFGVVAGITGAAVLGGYEIYEATTPQDSSIYLVDTGLVAEQGINGDRHYGHLEAPGNILDDARRAARERGLPVGAANFAIGWAGTAKGFDAAHCNVYRIENRGGDPLQRPVTFIRSVGQEVCIRALPFVEAAAAGGPEGVTPNIAPLTASAAPNPTPTPHP